MHISLDKIDKLHCNAQGRDDPARPDIAQLAKSIKELGQQSPVVVSRKPNGRFGMVEGHRRFAAKVLLGHKTIWAVVTKEDPVAVYRSLNANTRKHGPGERMSSYEADKASVNQREATAFQNMENIVGLELFKEVRRRGYNRATYNQARKIARYCERPQDVEFIRKTLLWLMNNRATFAARKALEVGVSAMRIANAIDYNLTPSFV